MSPSCHAMIYQGHTSVRALSIAVAVFVFGHLISVATIGAKVQTDLEDLPRSISWVDAFLPALIGDGLAILCEISSLLFLVPFIRAMLRKPEARPHSYEDDLDVLLPVAKAVGTWNCCVPMLGVLPPIPVLAFLLWFESWLALYLADALAENMFVVFVPLYTLQALGVAHFLLIADHSLMSGTLMACALITSVLVPLRVELLMGPFAWLLVFVPLILWQCTALMFCVYVLLQASSSRGRYILSSLQSHCLTLYALGIVCLIAGECTLSAFLDVYYTGTIVPAQLPHADTTSSAPPLSVTFPPSMSSETRAHAAALWPGVVTPIMASMLLFTVSVLLIACKTSMHLAIESYEVPRHLGAGWDVDNGVEDWVLLGHVKVRPATLQIEDLAHLACVSRENGTNSNARNDKKNNNSRHGSRDRDPTYNDDDTGDENEGESDYLLSDPR